MIKKEAKRGFTLVELLLVIAIIGILAAVLFVGLGKQRERARKTTFKENTRGLVTTYTACTDGGGIIGIDVGDFACVDSLGNQFGDIGLVPPIPECDGSDANAAIASGVTEGDHWYFQATCTDESGDTCVANCSANGCVFCDDTLEPNGTGGWTAACASSQDCE